MFCLVVSDLSGTQEPAWASAFSSKAQKLLRLSQESCELSVTSKLSESTELVSDSCHCTSLHRMVGATKLENDGERGERHKERRERPGQYVGVPL